MNTKKVVLLTTAVIAAVAISLLLISALAAAQQAPERESYGTDATGLHASGVPSVTFPSGSWPWYAHQGLTIHPEPFVADQPSELCASVINEHMTQTYTASIEFSVGNFGINVPFEPVGLTQMTVPPGGEVTGCIVWIPPDSNRRNVQARLVVDGFDDQIIQRNLDMGSLQPLVPQGHPFDVRNPATEPLTIGLGLIAHLPGWGLELSEDVLVNMEPGELRTVILTITPPVDLPEGWQPIVDVEAYIGPENVGGFRKVFRPPILLHRFPDPPYAEGEISIHPYPPHPGEPTEICVELRNPTPESQETIVFFSWSQFGIGLPYQPINGPRPVYLPPQSIVQECIHWVPPIGGNVRIQVELEMAGYAPQQSRRNIDADEPLEPGVPHARPFIVHNPHDHPLTITLGLIPHLPDWGLELSQDFLPDMAPGAEQVVTLTVTPPPYLPPDEHPIVDVEAYAEGGLLDGFRKLYRPAVPIHRSGDPIYAESEIFVHPYPPRAHEPTEVGAEIYNMSDDDQPITITFSFASFGIGLPFIPINEPIPMVVPAHSMVRPSTIWVPPDEGSLWCFQVEIDLPGLEEPLRSQRNIDVGEPLEPNQPHSRPFIVHNPFDHPVTITLGLIPHFPDWDLELSNDILPDMEPGEERVVILTVTPPSDLPWDGDPIVDVEAYAEGELIGGFRKIYRPPVPVHRPKDPVYAESEIGVDPYPIIPGEPVHLSVEVFNPTEHDQIVTVTFSVAHFGIGLPFTTTGILHNPIHVFVPAHGAARAHTIWEPPPGQHGKFCVQVELEIEGHEPVWSRRNIDVGEPLEPGVGHALVFEVRNPHNHPVTITLGLIPHRHDWGFELSPDILPNVMPGEVRLVTLTTTPPPGALLGTGEPIVDVEAYADGELIGGFRKADIPPVPLHKPHEKGYAESEISIDPYPPQQGQPTQISTVVYNTSDVTMTVKLEFGWAKFGMGIPFSTTGILTPTRWVTLAPETMTTVSVTWIPAQSGHQCVRVLLSDAAGLYEPQESQRNVDVEERAFCGTNIFSFTVYNDSPFTATVDIGLITFNVPEDWEVSTIPTGTLELGPFSSGVITVVVKIPCPSTPTDMLDMQEMHALQEEAGSVPTIDVEGYVAGDLVGGIEIQLSTDVEWPHVTYLPIVMKDD